MFKPLPCCLALLAIAIGEPADVQLRASDIQSMEHQDFRPQTLFSLETWVSTQFDLPAIHEHPSIEFASPAKIVSLRFAGLPSDPGEQVASNDRALSAQHDTIAIYYDATRTIYLPEGWTGDTPAELCVLVHEVVHHFQNVLRLKYECPQEREKLAYIAQDRWLALFGHSLESDFHMDAFSSTIEEAAVLAVFIERAARMQVLAQSIGKVKPIDPAIAREAHDYRLKPRAVAATFHYFARGAVKLEHDVLD